MLLRCSAKASTFSPVDPRIWLHAIIKANALAQQFVEGVTFEEYALDAIRSSAVERQLGIVGKAVAQVLKLEPDAPLSAAWQITGFQNTLIHNDVQISNAVVWTILNGAPAHAERRSPARTGWGN